MAVALVTYVGILIHGDDLLLTQAYVSRFFEQTNEIKNK